MKKNIFKVAGKVQSLFPVRDLQRQRRKVPGEIPGTAVHTGTRRVEDVQITVHDFDAGHYDKISIETIQESDQYLQSQSKTWIHIQGLHDIDTLKSVWEYFRLHPLIQEDIVNTSQRPKVEHYVDAVFLVLRMIVPKSGNGETVSLHTEQVSIILGENYVLSFQESDEAVFDPVLKRLELSTSRLRRLGTDYLAYALADTIVDHYFQALDVISESLENLEDQIIVKSEEKHLHEIHTIRRDLIYFRKSVWSLRDAINSMIRDDLPFISAEVKVFLRDVYDHVVQVIDSIESNREMVFGLYDIYMSGISNRMNEIMKVLTIIATIFIPLTFIAGVYGMNFDSSNSPFNMPELDWYFGYPAVLILMLLISAGMVRFFQNKGWL